MSKQVSRGRGKFVSFFIQIFMKGRLTLRRCLSVLMYSRAKRNCVEQFLPNTPKELTPEQLFDNRFKDLLDKGIVTPKDYQSVRNYFCLRAHSNNLQTFSYN